MTQAPTPPTSLTDPSKTQDQIGYDPDYNPDFGPITPQEWAMDFAFTYMDRFLSGNLGNTGAGSVWDANLWGGALPGQEIRGSGGGYGQEGYAGIGGAADWNVFYSQGLHLVENMTPDQLATLGLPPPPTPLEDGTYPAPVLTDTDKVIVSQADVTASEAERNRAQGNAALINANANMLSAQNEPAIAALRASTDLKIANIRAAVDREAIAVQRFGIQEGARQFDLQIAEDRRQFNEDLAYRRDVLAEQQSQYRTGVVLELFDRGVELSRQPVDWVAHQYFMANMGAPLAAAGLISSAAVFGAVPPSGPSAVGPVVGGPAAMDGDTALASSLGVEAGFVPVSQAVNQLPGDAFGGTYPEGQAPATVAVIAAERGVTPEQIDQEVAATRATEVAPTVAQNPVMDAAATQVQGIPTPDTAAGPQTLASSIPTAGLTPAPATPPVAAQPDQAANTGPDGQDTTGIYVGEPATSNQVAVGPFGAVTGAGSGAQNPQGEQMLALIAAQTGIPIETLRSVVPTNLLAGGYSADQIANSPVVQSLRTGAILSETRQDPVGEGGLTIQALGVPLGIRSGQDIQAQTFLKAGEVNRGLLSGALSGAGLNANDAFRASVLSSPVSNLAVGSQGRRVFR